jgi:hypothetical protein
LKNVEEKVIGGIGTEKDMKNAVSMRKEDTRRELLKKGGNHEGG